MGGGLLQLISTGLQDTQLLHPSGKTFFRQKYSKHKNFAIESIEQTFEGQVGFGQKVVCNVARNGDLCTGLMLEIKLKKGTGTSFYCAEHLLKSIELYIGGVRIDALTNTYMRIYDELHRDTDQRGAYRHMTDFLLSEPVGTIKRFYVPIPFWFCNGDPSAALPLISLQYHEVKLAIRLEDKGVIPGVDATFEPQMRLWVDYVFLDADERRWFAQSEHQYLIEQTQMHREAIAVAAEPKQYNVTVPFNHPVKYLAWVLKPSLDTHGLFTAKASGLVPEEVYGPLAECALQLNGTDRMVPRHGSYFRLQHPWMAFNQTPSVGVYTYSFALHAKSPLPTGSLNFSRIDAARLILKTKAATRASVSAAGDDDTTVATSANLKVLEIYARNLNVFRVVGGMGGVLFDS